MDAGTAIGGPGGRFPSTRVSLIKAAASGLSDAALDQVIALYWKPVHHDRVLDGVVEFQPWQRVERNEPWGG